MGQDNHNGDKSGAGNPAENQQGPADPWARPADPWSQPSADMPPPTGPALPPQWGGQPGPPQNPWGQGPYGGPGAGFPQPGTWTPPPKPGIIPLRPLGLGEMLDGAFQACRRNAAATFGSALLVQAVVAVLTFLLARDLFSADALSLEASTEDSPFDGLLLSGLVVISIVSVVGLLLLQGILVLPVSRSILNLRTGFAQTWRLGRNRLLPLAGLGLLLTAVIVVGTVLFVLLTVLIVDGLGSAGIVIMALAFLALVATYVWLAVKLCLAPAALVLEPAGVFASLARSWRLTRGNFWRTFGILVLTSILVSIIANVISVPITLLLGLLGSFGSGALEQGGSPLAVLALSFAITSFFSAIGYAFQAGVTSLLYVDLRIRREGFDITLMKEQESQGTQDADLIPGRQAGAGSPKPGSPPDVPPRFPPSIPPGSSPGGPGSGFFG